MPDENQIIEPLREQAARNEEAGFPHPVVHLASAEAAVREAFAAGRAAAPDEKRITHGRHCICSACAAEDWTNPKLAPCGMHGSSCPREYAPLGPAGRAAATQRGPGADPLGWHRAATPDPPEGCRAPHCWSEYGTPCGTCPAEKPETP